MNLKIVELFSILATLKSANAALFNISNNCAYTVWAAYSVLASIQPGGGRELKQGQYWVVNSDPNYKDPGRLWGRTNCQTNTTTGSLSCESGDCDGAFYCQSYGSPPHTVAEYRFSSIGNLDLFDISLMNGFNIPMEFRPLNSGECINGVKCSADINSVCPTELIDQGGCNHPCTVFENDQHCCRSGPSDCKATPYSKLFKDLCPDVYTTPYDDTTGLFSCPRGTDYAVVFCPT